MSKQSNYRISGLLADELLVALSQKKVPVLFIQYNIGLTGESGGNSDCHNVSLNVSLSFGDGEVQKNLIFNFAIRRLLTERSVRAHVSQERLGMLDYLEQAIKEGLAELLPELSQELRQVKVSTYTVNAIGHDDSNLVSVSLRFNIPSRETECNSSTKARFGINEEETLSADKVADAGLSCLGTDTIRATVECMRVFFNWYLWRLMRRQRGKQRCQKS